MIYFDRFDICEAYWMFYTLWHKDGLTKRYWDKGRGIASQLHDMKFTPALALDLDSLTENGKAIYQSLVNRYHPERSHEAFT